MGCEEHGYTNPTYCPACDQEALTPMTTNPTDAPFEITDYEKQFIENPDWGKAEKIHDWRNYVSEAVRKLWTTFTWEQRVALYLQADEQALDEEWD